MQSPNTIPLGIQQLAHHPLRLLSGIAGLALVSHLLLAQLGFRTALLQGQDGAHFQHMANFSLLLTVLVGAVITYQVLALDARDHREEYTMLRALGYDLGFLQRIPWQQVALLFVFGYLIGSGAALALLPGWSASSGLALTLGPWQFVGSLVGTLASCAAAALLARRLQRGADPAEACL